MSQQSSRPPEIMAEKLSQLPGSVGSAWAREKRFADVLGRRMAYIERGVGRPIVFLHGKPDLLVPMAKCPAARRGLRPPANRA